MKPIRIAIYGLIAALAIGALTSAQADERRGEIRFSGKGQNTSQKPFRSRDGGWQAPGKGKPASASSSHKGNKPYVRSGPRREDVWAPSGRDDRRRVGDRGRDQRRDWRDQRRDWRDQRRDWRDRRNERRDHRRDWRDHRHRSPRIGVVVPALPWGYREIHHHRHNYFFSSGLWYRPWGTSYVRIAAPIGAVVATLPFGYTTISIGSALYYRYDDAWYRPHERGYVVVEPPERYDRSDRLQRSDDTLFAYPNEGQDEATQAEDRFECHSWAADQTGYDPSLIPAAGASAESLERRPDYLRAMTACLEGRGYTVR
ncbi:MAG: hypothetical protein KDG52_11745 [Rhodocyclaceae bacterium]|nr:hypothetical protein [Rhodocyclaceae bacterium]